MREKLAHTLKALLAGKRGKRGESLVEVLTAIVIGGLALIMMGMAISVASHMAIDSRDAMGRYYQANNEAVAGEASTLGTGTVTLTKKGDAASLALVSSGETMTVNYYANDKLGSSAIILYNASTQVTPGGGS